MQRWDAGGIADEPPPASRAEPMPVPDEPTDAEVEAIMQRHDRVEAMLDGDSLVISASEYTEIVMGIAAGLDPLFEIARDPVTEAAVDSIHRLGLLVGVKVRRASRGYVADDGDEEFAREDANRTAKLVRLVIRESREAWQVLTQPGHAIGDGVPMRMIARLDAIDEALAARFPDAMAAVRPGLDE
jgi:hypothetical protein